MALWAIGFTIPFLTTRLLNRMIQNGGTITTLLNQYGCSMKNTWLRGLIGRERALPSFGRVRWVAMMENGPSLLSKNTIKHIPQGWYLLNEQNDFLLFNSVLLFFVLNQLNIKFVFLFLITIKGPLQQSH